jgi:hypothetical protein
MADKKIRVSMDTTAAQKLLLERSAMPAWK